MAIAGAIAQVIYARVKGKPLGFMTYASLALVIVLGSATLLTNDPRFVLAKPAIGHFAIGAIMLKRGWMLRYLPPIVTETIPEYVTLAGYAWAALMFALGCRHHRGGADRRHEAVDVLCVGGAGRRQACGLRHPICRVPHPRHGPAARRRRRLIAAPLHTIGLRGEIGYTAARVDGNLRTIPVAGTILGRQKWQWTATGTSS